MEGLAEILLQQQEEISRLAQEQAELASVANMQTEFIRMAQEQSNTLENIYILLLVVVAGIGLLFGAHLYRAIRGAWEVS